MQKIQYDQMYREEKNHWWYSVRRLLIKKLIIKYKGNTKDLSIADIGCGTGLLTQELAEFGNVVGVDSDINSVNYCKTRGVDVKMIESSDLPLSSNNFDFALCLDVLEHIEDDNHTLREINRILVPGGYAIIFCPAFSFLWSNNDVVSKHFRRYTLPELTRKAENAGFKVVNKSYFNFILFFPIYAARLIMNFFRIKQVSEFGTINPLINRILFRVFKTELLWLLRYKLPFGVSCMIILQK